MTNLSFVSIYISLPRDTPRGTAQSYQLKVFRLFVRREKVSIEVLVILIVILIAATYAAEDRGRQNAGRARDRIAAFVNPHTERQAHLRQHLFNLVQ
jgi:putative exporter of polyketide antibiotics